MLHSVDWEESILYDPLIQLLQDAMVHLKSAEATLEACKKFRETQTQICQAQKEMKSQPPQEKQQQEKQQQEQQEQQKQEQLQLIENESPARQTEIAGFKHAFLTRSKHPSHYGRRTAVRNLQKSLILLRDLPVFTRLLEMILDSDPVVRELAAGVFRDFIPFMSDQNSLRKLADLLVVAVKMDYSKVQIICCCTH